MDFVYTRVNRTDRIARLKASIKISKARNVTTPVTSQNNFWIIHVPATAIMINHNNTIIVATLQLFGNKSPLSIEFIAL